MDAGVPWRANSNGTSGKTANRRDHGIDFAEAERFEWDSADLRIDDRDDYGELREVATGFIGETLHVLVFTRNDDSVRIISLRKATKRERRQYGQGTH